MATFIENLRESIKNPFSISPSKNILFSEKTSDVRTPVPSNNQEAAERGTMYVDERLSQFLNDDIYRGYNNLNKILDSYDAAETYEDKDTVIKQGYANYKNKNKNIADWFDLLKNLNDYANSNNDPTQNVSKTMRYINDFTRKNLYPIL